MLRYVLYSTTATPWYQEKADKAAWYLSQTPGREVKIDVIKVSPPRTPQTIVDQDGDTRFSWDWFTATFPKGNYDGVGFHFTPYYKRKWGLSHRINGTKHSQNKDYPEFWMCCEKEDANGYEFLSNFERLFIHEVSHFDEDIDDKIGNVLTQESVHWWDYEYKSIQHYPRLVDYNSYNFRKKIAELITKVLLLIQKVWNTSTGR